MDPQNVQTYRSGLPPRYQAFDPSHGASTYQTSHAQSPERSTHMPGAYPQLEQLPPDATISVRRDQFAANNPFKARQDKGGVSVSGAERTPRLTATAAASSGQVEEQASTPSGLPEMVSRSLNLEEIYIAIMGVTGSGKSQFIQRCSESRAIKIGHSLRSCTQDVGEHSFLYRDKRIHLVDTPGFDDTTRTDREVLDEIARWFGTAYRSNIQLTGILYLHRITEPRMAGTAFGNLRMFKKLCGENFYPRVSLCTTFWDTVHRTDAERRQKGLVETDEFWGRMVARGSKVYRHYGDRESAMDILNSIINHRKDEKERNAPSYVRVQREMAEENMTLDETSAGQEVNAKILEERKKFEKQLKEAKEDMRVAMEDNDRKATEAIRKHKEAIEMKLKKGYEDQEKLNVRLEDMQAQHMKEMEKLLNAIDAQKSQIEALESQNREKAEKLKNLNPQSSTAIALRRELDKNEDKLEEAKGKLEEDRVKLEPKINVLRRAYEWAKRHPNSTARAGMIAVQFVENVLAARRIKLVERHRQLSRPSEVEFEIEDVDDELGHPANGHSSSAGFLQDTG